MTIIQAAARQQVPLQEAVSKMHQPAKIIFFLLQAMPYTPVDRLSIHPKVCFRCCPWYELITSDGLNFIVKMAGAGELLCYKLVQWLGFPFVLLDERVNYRVWRRRATDGLLFKNSFHKQR
ncbi:hypothetical protein [Paenibacillus sp. JGP012]|uniref:hypothetical protein n=1 Tax=Paenibacillus sp. JGP012 TaxID=2735914 RepID=UPI00160DF3E2|nr:hypothetical protein [Paenibacillus sp. JGP012]